MNRWKGLFIALVLFCGAVFAGVGTEPFSVRIDGPGKQSWKSMKITPEMKWVRVRMRMRTENITVGDAGWKDGRLAMRFFKNGKATGPWPEVFHASGTTEWRDCERYYPVPEGAEKTKTLLADLQVRKIKGNRPNHFGEIGGNHRINFAEDVQKVRSDFCARNIRDLRVRGISGLLPWDQPFSWIRTETRPPRVNPKHFESLKQPGLAPDRFVDSGEALLNPEASYKRTPGGEIICENFQEYLGFLGGKVCDFTENSRNFNPGEPVEKSLILLNDSRRERTVAVRWSVPELGISGTESFRIPAGEQIRHGLTFRIPADYPGKTLTLSADFEFPGKTVRDSMTLFITPTPQAVQWSGPVGVFDPENTMEPLLTLLKIPFRKVRNRADLRGTSLFLIGRRAAGKRPFSLTETVKSGVKTVLMEQTAECLENWGLRTAEYGFREVFPLDSRFGTKVLRDWRGSATLLPDYFDSPEFEFYLPKVRWRGFLNTRVWRAGNRGNVTSVPIEKPPVGNWLPLLQTGFDLQNSPLLVFREKNAVMIFCQLDISGRTAREPEALKILEEVLRFSDRFRSEPEKKTCYTGDPRGQKLLDSLSVEYSPVLPEEWTGNEVLAVGPGANPARVKDALEKGCSVVALGLSSAELKTLGAVNPPSPGSAYSEYVPGLRSIPQFAGISNADAHWREAAAADWFPSDSPGGRALSLERVGKGTLVMIQAVPWIFDEREFYLRTTVRRTTFLVSRILSNLGVPFRSGLPERLDRGAISLRDVLPNRNWAGRTDPRKIGRKAGFFQPGFRMDSLWKKTAVPGYFNIALENKAEAVGWFWYRLEFDWNGTVPEEPLTLDAGPMDDESAVWLNGRLLGEVNAKTNPKNYWCVPRKYPLRKDDLKPGKNVLTVLVNNLRGNGGMTGTPALLRNPVRGCYTDTPAASDDPLRYYKW